MATINGVPARIEARATMTLNEGELRALEALTGYGDDAFIQWFYKNMGKAYMQPHEAGLRSLFKSVRAQVPAILRRVDRARAAFEDEA